MLHNKHCTVWEICIWAHAGNHVGLYGNDSLDSTPHVGENWARLYASWVGLFRLSNKLVNQDDIPFLQVQSHLYSLEMQNNGNIKFYQRSHIICTHLHQTKHVTTSRYWGPMMYICIIGLGHHWFRQWLVAFSAPSHCLIQCYLNVNWTPRNKLLWFQYISIKTKIIQFKKIN